MSVTDIVVLLCFVLVFYVAVPFESIQLGQKTADDIAVVANVKEQEQRVAVLSRTLHAMDEVTLEENKETIELEEQKEKDFQKEEEDVASTK